MKMTSELQLDALRRQYDDIQRRRLRAVTDISVNQQVRALRKEIEALGERPVA